MGPPAGGALGWRHLPAKLASARYAESPANLRSRALLFADG
jgi:hypothetical protein